MERVKVTAPICGTCRRGGSERADEQADLEGELQRARGIAKAISLLAQAGDELWHAATGEDVYQRALRQAGAAHYRAKMTALSNELKSLATSWERVPELEKKARTLGLLR